MIRETPQLPKWFVVAAWMFATVFPLVAISGQSFWIDEAIIGNITAQRNLRSVWHELTLSPPYSSDLQLPLYLIYMWGWQKIFDGSEISLRLANYPWFLLGQLAAAFFWTDRRKGLFLISIAASSSFLWFYLNEARPYVMEYGAACLIVWFLCCLVRENVISAWKYWVFAFGLIALAGASMLGVFWIGTALLVATYLIARKQLRPPLLPVLFCAVNLLIMGLYYLWTLTIGARATRAHETIFNILYVGYELFGFAGLGPGRLEIREHGLSSFTPHLFAIAVFALVLLLMFAGFWTNPRCERDKKQFLVAAIFALPPVIFLSGLGLFIQFRVLGRHAMPAAPFVFMLLALSVHACLRIPSVFIRGSVVAFFALALFSSLGVRFLSRHLKDDYRGAVAAALAMLVEDQLAWWCASKEGAQYYHLAVDGNPDNRRRRFIYVVRPTAEELRKLPAPDLVVLSKEDIYDSKGTVAGMLENQHFIRRKILPAFSIWQKQQPE